MTQVSRLLPEAKEFWARLSAPKLLNHQINSGKGGSNHFETLSVDLNGSQTDPTFLSSGKSKNSEIDSWLQFSRSTRYNRSHIRYAAIRVLRCIRHLELHGKSQDMRSEFGAFFGPNFWMNVPKFKELSFCNLSDLRKEGLGRLFEFT